MGDIYEQPRKSIEKYVEVLPTVDEPVGAVFTVKGEISGIDLFDRFAGALLGLVVGDAVGTTVEFGENPATFEPVTEMVGGAQGCAAHKLTL
jgi:hypothetical protein